MRRLLLAIAVGALGAMFVAPAAHAGVGVQRWESLTCKENADLPAPLPEKFGEPEYGTEATLSPPPGQCTGETSAKLFTQAAGHPNYGITDFKIDTYPSLFGVGGFPTTFLKDVVVDTPEGLSVNPEALPQCEVAQLAKQECPPTSLVGINYLTVAAEAPNSENKCVEKTPVAGECLQARVALPVYNLVPFQGVPSMVGFLTKAGPTFVVGSLSPVDQHVTFTISGIHPPNPANPEESPPIIESRLLFFSAKETNVFNPAADGTYLTMPSNCAGGQVSHLYLDTQGPPYESEASSTEASYTTPTGASGCASVPFDPEIAVSADGAKAVDSPEATTVDVGIPWNAAAPIANSYLKVAKVTLPEGMGINPSAGNGLQSCSDAQFHYHTNAPVECPAASRIGSVDIETPSLPNGSIGGDVFVGQPLKNGPGVFGTGEQFRIFIHAYSTRYGVNVRLEGKVYPNGATGRLTAVVPENPQATFRHFRLHFLGGAKGVLTSPPTCGPNTTTTEFTPWSGHADHNTPRADTPLAGDPGGGSCPTSLGARKFAPGFAAASESTAAGKYSPFKLHLARADGQQELKALDVTLPEGLVGRLAGIPYCGAPEIAAAAASPGTVQLARPSCPADSAIGQVTTASGTGPAPLVLPGTAYLAGPYKGAPLSMVVVTPAVSGPFDLGTVVVRVALRIDPRTARVDAVSDPIPHVFGGVKLDVRSIDVNMDRHKFMVNPTNCAAGATAGTANGGGADPANPAAWSGVGVAAPFRATGCGKLAFKPKLYARISGPSRRTKNPRIRVVVKARRGDANIARTALNLPHALFLDQGHIKDVCTRVQLAARECPKSSVYGHAWASSPLLQRRLKGPVYLVSSKHKLPDLLADLRGQINIQLDGVISSKHGGMKAVFNNTPDVPLKTFVLNMRGGKKSLLQNSIDLCERKQLAILNIKGQNGRKVKSNRFRLNVVSCPKHGKRHKRR